MIEIVSATRLSESDFWNKSALGISLRRLRYDSRLVARLAFENRRGLPEIYNARISAGDNNDILVFIHDDVWIDDYFLADRVIEGLRTYDVIGIAGNRRRVPHQPAWGFLNTRLTWDDWDGANISGSIAQGKSPFGPVAAFGAVPADCELLDGVFLAARKAVLTANEVLFDPRFDFHFYDMDFCRSARQRGLRLGTWPICLTHQSSGAFGTAKWHEKYRAYIEKWGD
jgi:GT2 family glycosyltransferase